MLPWLVMPGLAVLLTAPAARADITSPLEIPDHVLWLEGADFDGNGTPDTGTSGTPLATWVDKSPGQGVNSVAATGGAPTMQFGSTNAVRFTGGSEDKLDNATLNVSGDYTVFTISQADAFAGSGHLLSGLNSEGTDAVLYRNSGGGYNFYSGQSTGNVNHQFAVRPASAEFKLTGYQISSAGIDTAMYQSLQRPLDFGGAATLNGVRVGNLDRDTPSSVIRPEAFNGQIAEVLIYNRQLTPVEISEVGNYLNAKYNLKAAFATGAATQIETGNVSGGSPSTLNPGSAAFEGGRVNVGLATTGGTAFSQNHIAPGEVRDFSASRVNDGLYADGPEGAPPIQEPWIAGTQESFVGISLSGAAVIDRIGFETQFPDRRYGAVIMEYTTDSFSGISVHNEEGLDPAGVDGLNWSLIDVAQLADDSDTRHLYAFDQIEGVTGVRLRIESPGAEFAISEIEIWAVPEAGSLSLVLGAGLLLARRQRRP